MYSFENIFIRTGTESGLRFVPHSAMACPGSQHFFSHLQVVQTGNKGTFPKGDTDFHTWTLSLLRLAQEALFLSNAPTLVFLLVPKDSGNWVFAYLFVWGVDFGFVFSSGFPTWWLSCLQGDYFIAASFFHHHFTPKLSFVFSFYYLGLVKFTLLREPSPSLSAPVGSKFNSNPVCLPAPAQS